MSDIAGIEQSDPDAAPALRRICLAEDDEDIRLYIGIILGRAGFTTESYDNGVDALAAAHAAPPDLFVVDRRMPGMDGLELCRRLRSDPQLRERPIMLISAETTDLAAVASDAGADTYLPKPFSRHELLAKVNELLDSQDS